ncbi:hypothetical protein [Vibrio owensii]|uniref:hypothetical protein n=1 Tax=Vibrio owensii TaxID=696485 RepID=UPI003CC5FA69
MLYRVLLAVLMFSISSAASAGYQFSNPFGSYQLVNPLQVGELELKFGGWSHHFGTDEGDKYEYNQSHNGFGLEYYLGRDGFSPHRFGVGFWKMKDSYSNDAYHIGAIYKFDTLTRHPIIDMFDFNLAIYYMDRTKRIRDRTTKETLRFEAQKEWVIQPYLTIRPTRAFSVDIMYVPDPSDDYHVQTVFVRGSLNTNELTRLFHF